MILSSVFYDKKTDCSEQSDGSKLTTNVLLLYTILTERSVIWNR